MIKEIKTDKFEGLALLVPDNTSNYRLMDSVSLFSGDSSICKLPYRCKILGKSTELTEEQCAEIVEMFSMEKRINGKKTYVSYNSMGLHLTAKESFESLMQSLQCYSVNPYGENKPFYSGQSDYDDPYGNKGRKEHEQWQQAQANTGTWVILKKIKNA